MGYGVVVAAHEVVKAGLGIHIVTTVTEGIEVADVVCVCYGISVFVGN